MKAEEPVRRCAVCADDFGMSEQICEAVLQLAAARAITATSCVVDARHNSKYARQLGNLADNIALGLHVNLTDALDSSASAPSLQTWWWRCYFSRAVHPALIRQELARQLSRFEDLFGRAPDFVDGHQHVHQLPVIREQLIEELQQRYGARVAVRSTTSPRWQGLKSTVIERLGGGAMRRLCEQRKFHMNSDFAGVYDFSVAVPYAQRMRGWLDALQDGALLMCHPEIPTGRSLHHAARAAEYDFFRSLDWLAMQAACKIELVKFAATAA